MIKELKTTSSRNQAVLDYAKANNIDLGPLVSYYGLRFVLKLVRSLKKPPKSRGATTTQLIYPKWIVLDKNRINLMNHYLIQVEEAGFKFRTWHEDFVDEDTGEIVFLERFDIYYIGTEK